jgi:hypothetical protein
METIPLRKSLIEFSASNIGGIPVRDGKNWAGFGRGKSI